MILLTDGTGFVGKNLVRRLRTQGLAVRALVRKPEKAQTLKDLGVELVQGDIADAASLEKACAGAERVVHLVGIIQEVRGATFPGVHVAGTQNVLAAAKKCGVRHFFFLSALGTRAEAQSMYHRTKWAAEELVRGSGIPFTTMRPSLIYGSGDGFTTRLIEAINLAPFLPIIGRGLSKVQPVFIDDVVACIMETLQDSSYLNAQYEIGGPDQLTYEEVSVLLAEMLGIRRPVLHLLLLLMKPMARLLEVLLPAPPITTDQLIMLQEDNICDTRNMRQVFGFDPIPFREGLARFIPAR